MPAYNDEVFDPPAPFALVELRHPASGVALPNVPMLMDTGADVTPVPQAALDQLGLTPASDVLYELAGFGGGRRAVAAIRLEMVFSRKTFRGLFCPLSKRGAFWGAMC